MLQKTKRLNFCRFYLELLFFLIFFLLTSSAIILKRVYFNYLRVNYGVYESTHSSATEGSIHRRSVLTTAILTTAHVSSSDEQKCINISNEMTSIIDSIHACKCIYLYPVDPLQIVSILI